MREKYKLKAHKKLKTQMAQSYTVYNMHISFTPAGANVLTAWLHFENILFIFCRKLMGLSLPVAAHLVGGGVGWCLLRFLFWFHVLHKPSHICSWESLHINTTVWWGYIEKFGTHIQFSLATNSVFKLQQIVTLVLIYTTLQHFITVFLALSIYLIHFHFLYAGVEIVGLI